MEDTKFLFDESNVPCHIGVLSDQDGKTVEFYENKENPAGNSYYRENSQFSPAATHLYSDEHKVIKVASTLDTVVKQRGWPAPDLIKMDIQGAEMDVLKGAQETLKSCQNLILELQTVEYNTGAPLKDEVISYVESLGFRLVESQFAQASGYDGDYHFTRAK
jgi:FkbM family methyltransferase